MALLRVAVAVVLALNGYVVTSGMAALTRDVSGVAPAARRHATRAVPCAEVSDSPSASVILSRNPFDSETGPLDVAAIPVERLIAGIARVRRADPLNAPQCAGVVVLATAVFDDPRRSTAVLRAEGDQQARVRRVRDRVGEGVVTFIGENPIDARPAVWIDGAAGLCQARLFPSSRVDSGARGRAPQPRSLAHAELAGSAELDSRSELLARIRPLGPTLVQVDRAAIDPLFERYEQYTKLTGARSATLSTTSGQRGGIDLGGVSPSGVLARLGFQANDRILSVGGHPVGSLEAVFDVASRLRTSSQIHVEVERDGRRILLEVAVR